MPRIVRLVGLLLLGLALIYGAFGVHAFGARAWAAEASPQQGQNPQPPGNRNWPRIQPFDRVYSFGRPQDMYLHQPVLAVTGKPAYVIECASPENERARAAGFQASRQFECRLSVYGATSGAEMQLLAESSHASPESGRGAFTWNQLNGDCVRYPDYGSQRIFHLRNIRLIITVSNVRLGPETRIGNRRYEHAIQGFTIRLQGFFDPTATTEFAASSHYEPPKALKPDPAMSLLDCKVPVLKSAAK
jgi:hypothetical protein